MFQVLALRSDDDSSDFVLIVNVYKYWTSYVNCARCLRHTWQDAIILVAVCGCEMEIVAFT